jgi:protein-tyrosine-phosphatase
MQASTRTTTTASRDGLRRFVPDFLLKQRNLVLRLGPRAGGIYAKLRLLDALGIRKANQRLVPVSARSFLFVCFGNIMRSTMAEFLMKQAVAEAGLEEQVQIMSAGLQANPGREAHTWAEQVSPDLGISLAEHRAKLLTREMVEQADCILAMDFQNKAELLVLYPESEHKIFMLSAYGESPWQYREIVDPYLGDLEDTRSCGRQLQICIRNLLISVFPSSVRSMKQNGRAP